MNIFKKFITLIILLTVLIVPISGSGSEVTDIGSARYYDTDVVHQHNLRNGVKQFTHTGMVSSAAGEVTDMGMGVSEAFVPDKYYPQQVSIIDIPATSGASLIPWAYISDSAWSLQTIGKIAKDYESKHPGEKVIAAVNGDFYDISGGKMYPFAPNNIHSANGDNFKSVKTQQSVGFLNDGSTKPLVGNRPVIRNTKPTLAIYDEDNNLIKEFTVDNVNLDPTGDEVSVIYPVYGVLEHGQKPRSIPIDVVDAYIVHDGEYSIPYSGEPGIFGYESDYEDFFGKGNITDFGSGTLKANDFAVKTTNSEVISYLDIGVKIRVQYDFTGDFAEVENIIGYNQPVLYNGEKVGTIKQRAPRTMVGVKTDGSYVLSVIDGRQPSKGMYGAASAEMAAILTHYGAVEAYNLDGGGSSAMAVLDEKTDNFFLVNTYSDSRERPVSNALLVVVKNPILEITPDVTYSSIKLNINMMKDNGFSSEDLYVKLNEQMKQVVDNEVSFTNLNKQVFYEYDIYHKENDNYVRLHIYDRVKTSKEELVVNNLKINYDGKDLVFTFGLLDVDNVIVSGKVIIGDLEANIVNGRAIFRDFKGKDFLDFQPTIIYDKDDYKGQQEYDLTNLIIFGEADVLIDYSLTKFNNFHKKERLAN